MRNAQSRRAREPRHMMNSPYSQVEAMGVTIMPGTAELTESKLVFCSSLKLPPEEFLASRDAMLSAFSDDTVPPAKIKSESANGQMRTKCTPKLRRQAGNGENNETVHIQVTITPPGIQSLALKQLLKARIALKLRAFFSEPMLERP